MSASRQHGTGQQLREAEVEELRHAVRGETDVARLDVAMQGARRMKDADRLRQRGAERKSLIHWQRRAFEPLGQRAAVEEFHHEHRRAAPDLQPVKRREVDMRGHGHGARLAPQAGNHRGVGAGQRLDRTDLPQAQIHHAIHHAHAAGADPLHEAKPIVENVGHGGATH